MNTNELIDSYYDEMLADLGELVKIPSVSVDKSGDAPFGKECKNALDKFLEISKKLGFDTENYDNYAGSVQLGKGKAQLGILGHLDVVPVCAEDWTMPPFEMTIKDGKCFGRGTIDDKGPTIAALYAMKAVKDTGALKKPVRLIVGCSEETGSEADIEHYMKNAEMPPMVFTPDGDFPVINGEKGMIRTTFTKNFSDEKLISLTAGTVVNAVPSKAFAVLKGDITVPEIPELISEKEGDNTKLTYIGKGAHASTPNEGINALTGLINVLADMGIDSMKPLAKLFEHKKSTITLSNGGHLTYVFSIVDYSNGKLTGKFDMRYPVGITKERIFEEAKTAFGKFGYEVEFPCFNDPHEVDENSEFVKTLLNVYHEETGLDAYCKTIGGGTYVHDIDGGVAFGAEFPGENNNMHGADEFMTIDNLVKCAKIYAKAIFKICC